MQKRLLFKIDYVCQIPPRGGAGSFLAYSLLGFSPFELLYGSNVKGPMQILRELWSVEETDEHARLTYQYVVDLRERLEKTCKLVQDNV